MHDEPRPSPNWNRRIITGLIVAGGLVAGYYIAAALIPRWWAQRVGDVVDRSLWVGGLYGLFIGFVFTLAPLLVALAVIRWRGKQRTWLAWLAWFAFVLLLAAPNLMTLGIVLGISNAAHDGDRTMSVFAPGFRLWSLIGALLAVAVVVFAMYLVRSRRVARRRTGELRQELRSRDQQT